MRLMEDTSDDSQGWIRVVSDERGATLRDGVSIDEATQIGRLTPGAVARFMGRAVYDSPGMGDHCVPVVRFQLVPAATCPGGWIS